MRGTRAKQLRRVARSICDTRIQRMGVKQWEIEAIPATVHHTVFWTAMAFRAKLKMVKRGGRATGAPYGRS